MLVLLVGGTALLGGCRTPEGYAPLPVPDKSDAALTTPTTQAPDHAAVELAGARGTTTTSAPVLTPGTAKLRGVVNGPNGPVAGAVVGIERVVGDVVLSGFVHAGADGSWEAANIVGGRYRVRAWLVPDLAQTEPQLLFVPSTGDGLAPLELRVEPIGQLTAEAVVAPDPPVVNQPGNLVVRLTRHLIDSDGLVRTIPQAGAAWRLVATGRWTLQSGTSTSDYAGRSTYRLVCGAPGPQAIAVVIGDETLPLAVPDCVAAPGSSSTSLPSSPSTTPPAGSSPTTVGR